MVACRLAEVLDQRPRQQAVVEISALAVRPEQSVRVDERADRSLRAVEFSLRGVRLHQPERQRMTPGVIADPVALGMRPLRERAVPRPLELLADHEERRFDAAPRQHVEHGRCHVRGRTVVEREREIEHGGDHTGFGKA